jgi:hypothetical protein
MNKVNKKAILAMIMSLGVMGVMGGISSNANDSNLQQVTVGCGYMAGSTEDGASGAWTAATGIDVTVTGYLFNAFLVNACNPLGWACTGVAAL